jgi:hypothetical protein
VAAGVGHGGGPGSVTTVAGVGAVGAASVGWLAGSGAVGSNGASSVIELSLQ